MAPTDIFYIIFAQFVSFIFSAFLGIFQAFLQAPV